ncbi:TetR/AcrR family transcriptional regulator [Brevibacterium oceani]|uniref:TetR/AcrR family transcriptional regulator n=1 Tax=Brevibacterium oceani TaxID=358099 RepID=UPI001B337856|nr:TetR/AcrR family transcriptional regulator [Brevibacterium oceani]
MEQQPIRDMEWTQARDVRRELDSDTKDALIAAARKVFSTKGFDSATIGDIASAARVSRPTFYVYFATKAEVFLAVATELKDEILEAHHYQKPLADDPVLVARASIEAFIGIYVDSLELLEVIEQRAAVDAHVAEVHAVIVGKPRRRILRQITEVRESGQAVPLVDEEYAARLMDTVIVDAATQIRRKPGRLNFYVEQATRVYFAIIGFQGSLGVLADQRPVTGDL